MKRKSPIDVVDVHVTSATQRVDAFSQYPLLDGDKQYTVSLTEFVTSLAGQEALPPNSFFANDPEGAMFIIWRKRRTADTIAVGHDGSSLLTLAAPLGGANGRFTNEKIVFRKNGRRPINTPSEMVYYMQRFFDDIKAAYTPENPGNVQTMLDLLKAAILGGDAGLIATARANYVAAHGGRILEALVHGGTQLEEVDDVVFQPDTKFVTVTVNPSGRIVLFFSPIFSKHHFLTFSAYGRRLLGLTTDAYLAFRTVGNAVVQGLTALTNNAVPALILEGGSTQTVEYPADYTLERYFEHRIRLEVESQMGTPPTTVWSTDDLQQMSYVIGTFPISNTTQSSIICNSEGAATGSVRYSNQLLTGDITWRRAEDKVNEQYLLTDSKFFHNIRLEIFIVRKEWFKGEFRFMRSKLVMADGESWTAKLRFRSVN